jgi:hypothetical protein
VHRITDGGIAFECAFHCGLLAVPGDGAVVQFANGVLELVCEDCRAALERGRPARSAGYLTSVDGAVHRAFMMAYPEGNA